MAQPRRMMVLHALVEDYIRSQEPVGSSSLTHTHNLGVSSATIRNDMAALESEGYLIQPHTSAGRIPTEKGYRYFVDRLSTVVPLSEAQRRGISSFLQGSVSLQDILRRSAKLLATITGQVAVVSSPALSRSRLRHLELVAVAVDTLLAVVITDTGSVTQRTLPVNPMPSSASLMRLCDRVNTQCAGSSFAKTAEIVRAIGNDDNDPTMRSITMALSDAFEHIADDERTSDLFMAGTSKLAHQHAVADLVPLFDALEEQVVLMKLMSALSEESTDNGVGVAIGSETHTPGLLHASVVTSGYGHISSGAETEQQVGDVDDGSNDGGQPVAFVGSIGPTHMDYAATITAVRAVARYLTAFIAHETQAEGN